MGIIEKEYMQSLYGGDLFYRGYKHHYADTELTIKARQDGVLGYNPSAVLVEVDYEKDNKNVNLADKRLYNKRNGNKGGFE